MTTVNDIALSVCANGKTAFYGAAKECGHILWEIELGIFHQQKPDIEWAFWLEEESGWDEYIVQLDEPLNRPWHGTLNIDYDKKIISENNTQQSLLLMNPEWFIDGIKANIYNYSSYLTHKTVKYHLNQGNVYFVDKNEQKLDIEIPNNLEKAYEVLCVKDFLQRHDNIAWIKLNLPLEWTYEQKKESERK